MNKSIAFGALAIALSWAAPSIAQAVPEPQGFVKLGVTRIRLADEGKIYIMGVYDPAAGYRTPEKWTANLELGYFVLPSVSVQGSVTGPVSTPNLPTGSLEGTPNLGDDKFSIFTLTAAWHPLHGRKISPYVGGGIAWQHVWKIKDGFAQNLNVDDATGPVIGGGVDFALTPRIGLYVDAKKAFYDTKASAAIGPVQITADPKLDPLILQGGVVFRF